MRMPRLMISARRALRNMARLAPTFKLNACRTMPDTSLSSSERDAPNTLAATWTSQLPCLDTQDPNLSKQAMLFSHSLFVDASSVVTSRTRCWNSCEMGDTSDWLSMACCKVLAVHLSSSWSRLGQGAMTAWKLELCSTIRPMVTSLCKILEADAFEVVRSPTKGVQTWLVTSQEPEGPTCSISRGAPRRAGKAELDSEDPSDITVIGVSSYLIFSKYITSASLAKRLQTNASK